MDPQDFYLIDRDLAVYPTRMLLKDKETLFPGQEQGSVAGENGSEPLPITPDGELRPGVLYASSTDANVRYYLPEYRLHVEDGRYRTSLKWRGPEADPNGPLAFLTIEVIAVAPPDEGFSLLEIPHQAVASIAYEMPIQAEAGASEAPAAQDPVEERPVLWLEVGAWQPIGGNVRRCQLPISDKASFDRLYEVLTKDRHNARLHIRYFATAGRRTWRHAVMDRLDLYLQAAILEEKGVLLTDLVSPSALKAQAEQPEIAADLIELAPQALPNLNATQVMQILADPGILRTLTPIGSTDNALIDAVEIEVNPLPIDAGFLDTTLDEPLNAGLMDITRARPLGEQIIPPAFPDLGGSLDLDRVAEAELDEAATIAPDPLMLQTVLSQAFAKPIQEILPESDLKIFDDGALKSAIPIQAVLNDQGKPALLKVPVEGEQWIHPFWFSTETNAYMFDIPGDMRPSTNHVFLPVDILGEDAQVLATFYQDSTFRDRFYYQPQEFRLPREEAYPYLPALRLTYLELLTQEEGGDPNQAGHDYRVRLTYRLVPYMTPGVLERAREQIPEPNPVFGALVPASSTLSLRIPTENGGEMVEILRSGTRVDFKLGIEDEIELTKAQFERLPIISGAGLDGAVMARLQDNQEARIPVNLSLIENAGRLIDSSGAKDQGGGKYTLEITNRIENTVSVDQLHMVCLNNGARARPLTGAGLKIKPGETVSIEYQVTPAGSDAADLRPLLSTSIELTNLKGLWPKLILNRGYVSDTFEIDVSTEPGFFNQVDDKSPQLDRLSISFGDGAKVTLDKDRPKVEKLKLRMPFLYRLLGDAEALNYEYWITNQYADGTAPKQGPLCTEQGNLTVEPVGAA